MRSPEKYVATILGTQHKTPAKNKTAEVFMPSNIALIKYWGKRQEALNLPLVSSLSYTLEGYGTKTKITLSEQDGLIMNSETISYNNKVHQRVFTFLDLFRTAGECYEVVTENNIPTASGVASSASGFAALTAAIIKLKDWGVSLKQQSMLARLGSGSAARSFWPGLVLWHKGVIEDGSDCFAEPLVHPVKGFCLSILVLDKEKKSISSRDAMKASLETSPLAKDWEARQQVHLDKALAANDFETLGQVAEENAILLHDMLAQSKPAIIFDRPATQEWKDRVRQWRAEGLPVYFTQDAGAQLKLIYPSRIRDKIEQKLAASAIDYFTVAA